MLKKKNVGQFSKNFLPKNFNHALKNTMGLGSGIRDPGSRIRKKPIPDPGVKKAPDPGSGSATLPTGKSCCIRKVCFPLRTRSFAAV